MYTNSETINHILLWLNAALTGNHEENGIWIYQTLNASYYISVLLCLFHVYVPCVHPSEVYGEGLLHKHHITGPDDFTTHKHKHLTTARESESEHTKLMGQ